MRRSYASSGNFRSITRVTEVDLRKPLALAAAASGALGSGVLLATGAEPGTVLVPFSVGALVALLVVPFPLADYLLAFSLIATFPLAPPLGLPNIPLALAVVVVALARVWSAERRLPAPYALATLGSLWVLIGLGVVLSNFPPLGVWLRPAAIVAVAALASLLGLLVWRNPRRRLRWFRGVVVASVFVSASALAVFVLQYALPPVAMAEWMAQLLGYLRGASAAEKFAAQTNWIIWGQPDNTLRAVSPLFPAPNNVGGYIGIIGPLAAYIWLTARAQAWRFIAATAVVLMTLTLVLTYSRSSWLAAACAGVAAAALLLVVSLRHRGDLALPPRQTLGRYSLIVGSAVLLGVAGLATTSNDETFMRLATPDQDHSVIERVEGDAAALERIRGDVFRGTGLGNWTGLADAELARRDPNRVDYVHNVYLEYANATGIFGLLWAVGVVALPIFGGLRVAFRSQAAQLRLLGIALLTIGVFAGVQFLFDDNLLNPQYAWLLLWVVGGGVALAATGSGHSRSGGRPQEAARS